MWCPKANRWNGLSVAMAALGPFALVLLTCTAGQAQDTAPTKADAAPPDTEATSTGWRLGADLYYGVSNLSGAHRYRDGFWIGAGRTFPSTITANYAGAGGLSGKLALSLGEIYNGSGSGFDQPVEAYISKRRGSQTFTAGKFYVPFELQEWEYEAEWGLQVQSEWKFGTGVLAVTDNRVMDTANVHGRFSHEFAPGVTGGLSLAGGRGFTLDSRHDRGAALDLTVERGAWKWDGAVSAAQRDGSADRFGFAYGRLTYSREKWSGYIARHTWHDRSGDLGSGHYSTLGGTYHLTQHLAVDAALSRTQPRTVRWIQAHYTLD